MINSNLRFNYKSKGKFLLTFDHGVTNNMPRAHIQSLEEDQLTGYITTEVPVGYYSAFDLSRDASTFVIAGGPPSSEYSDVLIYTKRPEESEWALEPLTALPRPNEPIRKALISDDGQTLCVVRSYEQGADKFVIARKKKTRYVEVGAYSYSSAGQDEPAIAMSGAGDIVVHSEQPGRVAIYSCHEALALEQTIALDSAYLCRVAISGDGKTLVVVSENHVNTVIRWYQYMYGKFTLDAQTLVESKGLNGLPVTINYDGTQVGFRHSYTKITSVYTCVKPSEDAASVTQDWNVDFDGSGTPTGNTDWYASLRVADNIPAHTPALLIGEPYQGVLALAKASLSDAALAFRMTLCR